MIKFKAINASGARYTLTADSFMQMIERCIELDLTLLSYHERTV